jgi:hypothetical protein
MSFVVGNRETNEYSETCCNKYRCVVVRRTEGGMSVVSDCKLLVMYVTLHDEGTARNISGKNNKKG